MSGALRYDLAGRGAGAAHKRRNPLEAKMFNTKKHLSRRTILRGAGVTLALPLLDAMVPSFAAWARTPTSPRTCLVAIEMVHGAAGSTDFGRSKNLWSPAQEGRGFQFTDTLSSLEQFREYITVISHTEHKNAMSLADSEDGMMADHARSSAVFLTGAHPKRTAGADIQAGPSLDQIYAQHIGHETPLPSIPLCIEDIGSLSGDCGHEYSCAYTNTISWASATRPLPMDRAPRAVFNRLFRTSQAMPQPEGGPSHAGSILDGVSDPIASFAKRLGPRDRARLAEYLDSVRNTERRIQEVEESHENTGWRCAGGGRQHTGFI